MLFLQDAGRTKLAQTIAALPIHLAIGRGLPAWDSAPEPPPATATVAIPAARPRPRATAPRAATRQIAFMSQNPTTSVAVP